MEQRYEVPGLGPITDYSDFVRVEPINPVRQMQKSLELLHAGAPLGVQHAVLKLQLGQPLTRHERRAMRAYLMGRENAAEIVREVLGTPVPKRWWHFKRERFPVVKITMNEESQLEARAKPWPETVGTFTVTAGRVYDLLAKLVPTGWRVA